MVAATLSQERQETRGMLGAITVWPEVADVRTYERTVCPVFETKSSSNSSRTIRRLPNAPRTDRRRSPCDMRRVHPRAILARAARTCRGREREEDERSSRAG